MPVGDFVHRINPTLETTYFFTPKRRILIDGLSTVCQGDFIHWIDKLTKIQIAPFKGVLFIKSPHHTPTPPSTLHRFLPALGH